MIENIKAAFGVSIFCAGLFLFPLVLAMIPLVIIMGTFFHHQGYRVVDGELVQEYERK